MTKRCVSYLCRFRKSLWYGDGLASGSIYARLMSPRRLLTSHELHTRFILAKWCKTDLSRRTVHAGVWQGSLLLPLLFLAVLDGKNVTPCKNEHQEDAGNEVWYNKSFPVGHSKNAVERVHKLTYPGSCVLETGGTEEVIASGIANTRAIFAQLRPIWQS